MSLTLPWPDRDLSPNRARNIHWSRKAQATRNYRYMAKIITLAQMSEDWKPQASVPMKVTFLPPDRRRRDRTNMEASFKAGFDGIADALKVDDSLFVPTYHKGEPTDGGLVIVEIP